MHLTDLQYFQAIARTGSLSHTARVLGVHQPTLTVALRRLETELGTTLCFRDRRGVSLTTAGKALLQYVTDALALLEAGRQHVQTLESDESGDFVLGVPVALRGTFCRAFSRSFFGRPHTSTSRCGPAPPGPSNRRSSAAMCRSDWW